MNTLLKKHGKTILAVLGAFLMLTFTLPSVMKNNGDVSALEVGRLDGKKVVNGSILSASFNVNALARFGLLGDPEIRLPNGGSARLLNGDTTSQGLLTLGMTRMTGVPYPLFANVPVAYLYEAGSNNHEVERGTHWYLLVTEAQKLGILADPGEVSQVFSEVAGNVANGDTQQLVQFLYKQNITEAEFRGAIVQALMIRNLGRLAMRNIPASVPAVELAATETFATLSVDYAALDATKDYAKFPDPSAEQIQKQFGLYKSVVATPPESAATPPTIDGHTYPFGYKYPDRVKVEYLKFDRAEIAKQFKPTRDDVVEAYRYYQSTSDDPLFSLPRTDTSALSTQPAKKPFDAVREQLVQRQVDERINSFLKRITDRVSSMTAVPWADAKDENGYREGIPRSKWVDYKGIPAALKAMPEFSVYQPQYDAIDSFEGARQLAAQPGIGAAVYDNQGKPIPFAALATHVHELGDFPDFPRLYLQVGIDGPIVKDEAGNLYIFRVTEAEKTHEPASVEEARNQVVDDLKKVESFEQKEKDAKGIAEAAATGDFANVVRARGLMPAQTDKFRHFERDIPGLGNVPGFADAAYNLARGEEPGTRPASGSATQGAATKPVMRRTTTLPVESALKVYVMGLQNFNPETPEDFSTKRKEIVTEVSQEGGVFFATNWLSFEATMKRDKYVPARPFDKK